MSDVQNPIENIKSADDFIAHALALEMETYQSYQDLAGTLEAHNNGLSASLFLTTSKQIKSDSKALQEQFDERGLKTPPPWECGWASHDGLHSHLLEAHYLMSEHETIELIIQIQRCKLDFYQQVITQQNLDSLIPYAEQLIELGEKRVQEWNSQLEGVEKIKNIPDFDPPNMPE